LHWDLTVSLGNVVTLVTVVVGFSFTFGKLITSVGNHDRQIHDLESALLRQDEESTRRFEATTGQVQHLLEVLVRQQGRRP
jgi:hypothetical protein